MSELGPFDKALEAETAKSMGPFDEALAKEQKKEPSYRYSVLPFSEDEAGKVYFDPSSGILGAISSGVSLPGDVATGRVSMSDPEAQRRAFNLATLVIQPGKVRTAPPHIIPVEPPVSLVPEMTQAAERLGITLPRAVTSNSRLTQEAGKIASNAPLVGAPLVKASEEALSGLRGASEEAAAGYGRGTGPNVAHQIGGELSARAQQESAANAAAAVRANEIAQGTADVAHETAQDVARTALERVTEQRLQRLALQEQQAAQTAQGVIGNVEPFDAGAAITQQLRNAEQASAARRTAAYNRAAETGAIIDQNSIREMHARAARELEAQFPNTRIEPTLTPAASRMMTELANLSGLRLPSRAVGARMAEIPGQERGIAGITLNGIESSRKILNELRNSARNDTDRRAARIIMNEFDRWEAGAMNDALLSGDPAALNAFRKARAAHHEYRTRFGYNPEVEADNILNRIATGEVTPQETANWIVGASKVGAQGASARLIDRIQAATNNDPAALGNIRGAIWNRLTQTAEGVAERNPERVANDVFEFLNGSGRSVADRVFTPTQRRIAELYADTIRKAAEQRKAIAKGAVEVKEPKVKVEQVKPEVGPIETLAKRVLGPNNGRSDEALFAALEGYATSGSRGDLATLSKVLDILPQETRGNLAGAFIRKMGASPRQANEFSGDVWLSNWRKLTPQAKALMFGMQGNLRRSLDDIAAVSQRFKELNKYANPSGTARSATAGGFVAWLFAEPVSALSAAVGSNVAARILAQPAAASSFAKWSKAYEFAARSPKATTQAALSLATRNFAATVADKLGVRIDPSAFMQGITGARPSAAKDDNNQ